jgi:hypothetical protein
MTDTRFFVDGRARYDFNDRRTPSRITTPPSEATLKERRVALAHERRSNRCPSCFTARSLTGECLCTD